MTTREFWIPKGEGVEEIKDSQSSGMAYLYKASRAGWVAMGFGGKRSKPDFSYRFPAGRDAAKAYVEKYFKGLREREARKVAQRKERNEFKTSLAVGDILYTSWGYEQTNIDFYQVVEVKPSGKTVTIREIAKSVDSNGMGAMQGKATPITDRFKGEPMTKRVKPGERIYIESFADAYLWDGKPKYCSWYA